MATLVNVGTTQLWHPLMNVAQDMKNWKEAYLESEPFVRTPETQALLRPFMITADDSQKRCITDPPFKKNNVRRTDRTVQTARWRPCNG